MQNMKIVAKARPLIEKTPTAIIISTRVQPRRRLAALVNIVLDSIQSHVGAQGAGMRKPAGIGPSQADGKLAKAVLVIRGRADEIRDGNGHGAVIGSAGLGRSLVVNRRKSRRDEAVVGNLVPVIK